MKLTSVALVPLLALLLGSTGFAQGLVDVKPYEPSRKDGTSLGSARPRIQDLAVGRSDGRFPGSPRTRNGPAGIPERDEGNRRDPSCAGAPPASSRLGVSLVRHEVNVRIVDGVAVTTIDQTFHNDASRALEGTYLHDLPSGSVIDGFAIFMSGREVHGRVYERERGRALYDEIARKKKDPGIVELLPGEAPRVLARIFPIPAGGDFRVKTRYTHVMQEQRGTYATSLPLRGLATRHSGPIAELGISLHARSAWPLASVMTPDYDFRGLENGSRRLWYGTFTATDILPENDLGVRCIPRRDEAHLALYLTDAPTGERYFMAVVAAGLHPLTGATLDFGRLETGPVYPEAIPTLEPGRQTLVFGQLSGSRVLAGHLRGRWGDRAVAIDATPEPRDPSAGSHRFVAGMWAAMRVEELLARTGEGDPSPAVKEEIVRLAERYGILTPYTVFFAR